MAKYPYILKPGSLKQFLERIPAVGLPERVTLTYLSTLGLKSTNDRAIIPILKFLKLLDGSGVPTERYKNFRNRARSAQILGIAIQEAYAELFKMYPDADQKDHRTLQNFFSTNTGLGERAVKSMVETFRALCSIAELGDRELETYGAGSPLSKNSPHHIDYALSKDRKAKFMLPRDITLQEIGRICALLKTFAEDYTPEKSGPKP